MNKLENTCALICAYNEEKTIADIVERTRTQVQDVYVLDDGSSDKTHNEAVNAGAIVIPHRVNKGKGQALKTGFTYLADERYAGIITLDADGQHLPEEIPRFMEQLAKGFDAVIGRRDFDTSGVPVIRKYSNKLNTQVLSLINHQPVYDSECGFRAFKTSILPRLVASSDINGFSYESEILMKLLGTKVKIGWADISTVYIPGRISKIKPLKHTWDSIKVWARCWKNQI